LGNSEKIANLGLGIALTNKPLLPNHISDAINLVLDGPHYQRKANQVMKISENLNGIDNIVNIIRSYLK
jgi:UDP:flavonoid glycosyltransferase YjiC (YdhE family)